MDTERRRDVRTAMRRDIVVDIVMEGGGYKWFVRNENWYKSKERKLRFKEENRPMRGNLVNLVGAVEVIRVDDFLCRCGGGSLYKKSSYGVE